MNCFFVLLVMILLVGLAITQLALNFSTEGWLWPALHGILFLVSHFFKQASFVFSNLIYSFFNQISVMALWMVVAKAATLAVFPFNS